VEGKYSPGKGVSFGGYDKKKGSLVFLGVCVFV